jgi:hypothetical protein
LEKDNVNEQDAMQLGFAVGKQPGPDGKTQMVSLHLGNGVMSVAVVIPADSADEFADNMSRDIKKAGMECRLGNKGIKL